MEWKLGFRSLWKLPILLSAVNYSPTQEVEHGFVMVMYFSNTFLLPNSSLFFVKMNPFMEQIQRFNTDSLNLLPLFINKKL